MPMLLQLYFQIYFISSVRIKCNVFWSHLPASTSFQIDPLFPSHSLSVIFFPFPYQGQYFFQIFFYVFILEPGQLKCVKLLKKVDISFSPLLRITNSSLTRCLSISVTMMNLRIDRFMSSGSS